MHEKISRDLSLASPRLDALTDLTDVPELLTLGAMPQYEARWSWSGNLPMSTDTASCAAVLGPMWIGNTYLDDSGRDSPASLNSTGDM